MPTCLELYGIDPSFVLFVSLPCSVVMDRALPRAMKSLDKVYAEIMLGSHSNCVPADGAILRPIFYGGNLVNGSYRYFAQSSLEQEYHYYTPMDQKFYYSNR